ncbi:hypothetical protein LUI11_19395 [Bradyrhizobium diazoefficiens]|uniref:Uncharacterized protein n=1 Tax=Bradyrhizobium diazoefficiens SEMIA 5080 TaxID=754504 RepID=A0A837C4U9_9BRAD|nr:hypothetical protein [Bradyrhizobium diazoefficiens]APO56644.1 hypothetical protein BD122_40160 [Bradyrhizobium diazoefficiens]KGJ64048.1 hypothetical protein BJA5080_05850 [Bradyrhizobium diazoefficiens SEMIA 5080]MCD9294260.1 hypothetical protein [Bradyrhizobium diazoefficiens]MCD9812005.1 hypothetical protein [Bradyrhizobium diazoefficiens]MCD9830402.1 hypothetical protein [Bradyrhizobium diazoefficiens]
MAEQARGLFMRLCRLAILRIALSSVVPFIAPAHADRIGYEGVVDISAEAGTLRAEHHHDWGYSSEKSRWKMISSTRNPFTADNDYSYLRLHDTTTGTELFRRPVPALTYIWISPNRKYVVGLSHIMLWNPCQLVVFSKSGDRLLERDMVSADWPGVRWSASNWIYWYKEPAPKIAIADDGTNATLTIEDPLGVPRQFQFPAAR